MPTKGSIAPNVQQGTGRVHRARVILFDTVTTLCGKTLQGAVTTEHWVNCQACYRVGGA